MVYLQVFVFLVTASFTTPSHGSVIKSQPGSHLMFDYNWPQPDFKIRKYPHEKYCHYFYNWESGDIFTIRKCPKGEIFDFHSHECKEKKEAKCWSHLYGKTKGHDHIHTKLKKHFDCPFSSGRYPDVFVCEKYFVCKDGVSHQKHCPPTKLFDRIRRQCVDESVALCADITDAEDIHHRCPKPSGTFGHAKDCSKYYTCRHGEPTLKNCPEGELFNEVEMSCADNDVLCGDRWNPYSSEKVPHGNAESSKDYSSTLPPVNNLSKNDIKNTSKTDITNLTPESLFTVTSSAAQATISEIKESPIIASTDSKKNDRKETRMNGTFSTSSEQSLFSSTQASTSVEKIRKLNYTTEER